MMLGGVGQDAIEVEDESPDRASISRPPGQVAG